MVEIFNTTRTLCDWNSCII